MPTTYKPIATVTVGSGGASSIEFTSIPGTYTDLILKYSLRTTNAGGQPAKNISINFNSSTTNFSQRALSGGGSSASSFNRSDNLNYLLANTTGSTASTFSNHEIYIPNYAGSTNKSFSIDEVSENNATEAYAQLHAGLWSNTAAITSIRFTPQDSETFVQYSTATLYGIKNS